MADLLALTSGVGWTVAYIALIVVGLRDRACGMPFVALSLNITWEFLFGFVVPSPFPLQVAVNVLWFVFDVAILWIFFRFRRRLADPVDDRLAVVAAVLVLAVCFAIQYAAATAFAGFPVDAFSALFSNVVMSVLFLWTVVERHDVGGQSMTTAVGKLVGSAAAGLLIVLDTGSALAAVLAVAVLTADLLYIVMLRRRLVATRTAGAGRSAPTPQGART